MAIIKHPSKPSMNIFSDYLGDVMPFIKHIYKRKYLLPFLFLKTIEHSIYKWYEPGNESWLDYSYELIFQITNRCTDRCPKCGLWKNPERSHISVERVIQSIRSIRRNIWKVTVTGGEPLLYADEVLKLSEATAEMEIPITILTNGYLLTDGFLQKMKELGLNLIVSIDTLDEKKWIQYRGRDHFHIVKENLIKAIEVIGDHLSIQSILALETVDDLPQVAEFCRAHNLYHYIQGHHDFGGMWHAIRYTEELQAPCSAWLNICILPSGDVVRCFNHMHIPEARAPLGNINTQDIESILGSKRDTKITNIMQRCNLPCRKLRCNQK